MRLLGICLVALGVFVLAYHGYTLVIPQKAVELGPVHVSVDREQTYWISPLAGGITAAVGLILVLLGGRRPC